jgi:hypothetical protein
MQKRTIDLDDELDRWRYPCPHGHVHWFLRNRSVYCRTCRRCLGLSIEESYYDALVDEATGDGIPREQLELLGTRRPTTTESSANVREHG